MYPQNPYSGPMPLPQPPPRKDPVRTGLVVALALFLVAAVVLTAVLLWPKGSASGKRESAGSATTSSQPGGSSSSAPAPSSQSPAPTATSDQFSDPPPPSTGVGAPASPSTTTATTNGVSEQQRADACARATSGSVQKISRDTQWGIASGPDVTVLTTLLAFIGYDTAPTSTYSAQAEQAAMAFQQAHGLEVDGIVGEATWPLLAQEACTG